MPAAARLVHHHAGQLARGLPHAALRHPARCPGGYADLLAGHAGKPGIERI
ncbi:MAG: hypothetical protein M3P51_07075 [Chloroflexota bacterium]|nr:hypothetical protein [Chloroflexota bacterium]